MDAPGRAPPPPVPRRQAHFFSGVIAAEELRMERLRAGPGGHAGESAVNEQPCARVPLHHRTAQTIEEANAAADADLARRIAEAHAANAADDARRLARQEEGEEEG